MLTSLSVIQNFGYIIDCFPGFFVPTESTLISDYESLTAEYEHVLLQVIRHLMVLIMLWWVVIQKGSVSVKQRSCTSLDRKFLFCSFNFP